MPATMELLAVGLTPLTDEQLAGLGWAWWMYYRKCPVVCQATRAGYMTFYTTAVNSAFAHNRRQAPWRPTCCKELVVDLGIDDKHYSRSYRSRKLKTKAVPDTKFRYDHATALGVSEGQLSPSLRDYVARSTVWLVRLGEGPVIETCAACAYTTYLLSRIDHRGRPIPMDMLRALANELDSIYPLNPVQAILDVAQAVGKVLTRSYPDWMREVDHWTRA